MAHVETPPEAADGGFWYVVEPITTDEEGLRPPEFPGAGWCAWYGTVEGVSYAAVRCPAPVVGIPTADVPAADVLAAAAQVVKPRGRIGGR